MTCVLFLSGMSTTAGTSDVSLGTMVDRSLKAKIKAGIYSVYTGHTLNISGSLTTKLFHGLTILSILSAIK